MIFYFLSPPLLVLLYTNPHKGLKLAKILIAINVAILAILMIKNSHPPTQMFWYQSKQYTSHKNDYFTSIYIKPHTRMSSFIIGLILGLSLVNEDKYRVFHCKRSIIHTLFIISYIGLYPCNYNSHSYFMYIYSLIYGSMHRLVFAYCMCYYIINVWSHATNRFWVTVIRSRILRTVANVSYGAYLIHLCVIESSLGLSLEYIYFSGLINHTIHALFVALLSYIFAFIFITLPIEFPFMNLDRHFKFSTHFTSKIKYVNL